MIIIRRFVLAAALLLLVSCGGERARPTSPGVNPAEVQFTTGAYQLIEFDRQQGFLAQTRAKNPAVRALAQQLTKQASDFAARLGPTAAAAGIRPPTILRRDLRIRRYQIRLQQGLDFDRSYVADQIASHEEALRQLEALRAGNSGVSPEFAALMQQGTAEIKQRLEALRNLQREMGPPRHKEYPLQRGSDAKPWSAYCALRDTSLERDDFGRVIPI